MATVAIGALQTNQLKGKIFLKEFMSPSGLEAITHLISASTFTHYLEDNLEPLGVAVKMAT